MTCWRTRGRSAPRLAGPARQRPRPRARGRAACARSRCSCDRAGAPRERQLEDLLRPGSERRRAGRRRAGGTDRLLDLLAHRLERDAEGLERLGGEPVTLVDQTEQDVLGPDEAVVEEARLFLGQYQHPSCPVSEPLEQIPLP